VPIPFTAAEQRAITGSKVALVPRALRPRTDASVTGLGGDADLDGIPNNLDVDINGNLIINWADAHSNFATTNPWADLRHSQSSGAFNNDLAGVTSNDVASAIGGSGQFGTWFFIDETMLQQAAGTTSSIDWARIDCVTLTYCGRVLPGGTSYRTQFGVSGEIAPQFASAYGPGPIDWSTVNGGAFGDPGCLDSAPGSPTTGTFTRSDAGIGPDQPLNGLVLYCRSNGSSSERLWNGMIAPQTGADTLSQFTPGDFYVVNYKVHGSSTVSSLAMTLPPYGATVPGLTSVNGVAPTVADLGSYAPDSSGDLSLQFARPQRLALGVSSASFVDQASLHYGVVLGVEGSEYGCRASRYSALHGLVVGTTPIPGNLWPLNDASSVDVASP
jgi:hypothetical protein